METLPLFPPHNASPTSRQAAAQIAGSSKSLRAKVLAEIIAAGVFGCTDEELQNVLQLNPSTQRPRRIELVKIGLVEDSGKRRKTQSGRDATVWAAKCTKAEATVSGACSAESNGGK